MKLPTFEESDEACNCGLGTPLHEFIVHQEPAGEKEETLFRNQLQAAIDFIAPVSTEWTDEEILEVASEYDENGNFDLDYCMDKDGLIAFARALLKGKP